MSSPIVPRNPQLYSRAVQALERSQDLPPLPAVVLETLRVARDESASAEDLAAAVSLDPVLAAKILQMANSPLFGARAQISSLKRACTQLGFGTVRLMALSVALVDFLGHLEVEGIDRTEYWKRSVVRAVWAGLVAETVCPGLADEAFMTGLLSRIGQLFLATCLSHEYRAVLDASGQDWPSQELELEVLGFTSDQFTAMLLEAWHLPEVIRQVVLFPQSSQATEEPSTNVKALRQILMSAASCEELVCGRSKARALSELHELAKSSFSLDAEQLEHLLSQLDSRTAEVAKVLRTNVSDPVDMAKILHEAQGELHRETVALLVRAVGSEQYAAWLQFENSRLNLKAHTDPLTGVANREVLRKALGGLLAGSHDDNFVQAIGLLMIDVDQFKDINDTYGHPVGDQVLQLIAGVLRDITGEGDLVARYGGDEFVVVMPRATPEGLRQTAQRLIGEIGHRRLATSSGGVTVTISVGAVHSEVLESRITPEKLVEVADGQLYDAKRNGGNQVVFAAPPCDVSRIDSV